MFDLWYVYFSLARLVMEKTPHVLLAGQGANRFAKEQGIPTLAPGDLVSDYAKQALAAFKSGAQAQTEIGHPDVCIFIYSTAGVANPWILVDC